MFDQQVISDWLRARISVEGYGANQKAAEILGIEPSTMSHLLKRREKGFDQKTLNMVAWILLTKQDHAPEAEPDEVRRIEDLIFSRFGENWYWRVAE